MAGKLFHTAHPHTLTDIRLTLLTQIVIFWEKLCVVEDDTKMKDAVPYRKIDNFRGFAGFPSVGVDFRAPRSKKTKTKRFYTDPLGC